MEENAAAVGRPTMASASAIGDTFIVNRSCNNDVRSMDVNVFVKVCGC